MDQLFVNHVRMVISVGAVPPNVLHVMGDLHLMALVQIVLPMQMVVGSLQVVYVIMVSNTRQ